MNENNARAIAVGEVMVELARGDDGRFSLAFGGDTFNTAVYMARAGAAVAYATALGDDRYSGQILDVLAAESIARDLAVRVPGRVPGLYLIETDARGERSFAYWRDASPARELFELPEWSAVAEQLLGAQLLYFSGITLSLYSNTGLGRFLAAVEMARERGAKVAFDSNYRPRGWRGDTTRARTVYAEALKRTDIALPSFDDEAVLWGDASPEATVARLQAFGIGEIAVKNGAQDTLLAVKNDIERVPVPPIDTVVDTTAAGDSFNGTYLAARLAGRAPREAAVAAHALASEKVRHRGAIMPRAQNVMH